MFTSLWLSSLKRQLRSPFQRRSRARRSHQFSSAQALVSRNAAETLEDRTLLTTFTVVNTDDSGAGSLRDAIEQANANSGADTIVFDATLAGQTIVVSTEMQITDDLTITGLGADQLTLDGNGDSRIFNIDDGHTTSTIDVFLEGLSLTNGYFHSESGSIFEDKGGAIYSSENLTVTHSSFSGNSAREGGAIFHLGAMLTITQSDFFDNEVTASGGAIYHSGGAMTISDSRFELNKALGNRGGAIYHEKSYLFPQEYEDVAISNSEFTGNYARLQGGAICMRHNLLTVSNSTFTANTAEFPGGAISSIFGDIIVQDSSFIQNSTGFNGGAISSSEDVTISGSTFFQNSADYSGGAVYYQGSGNLSINNSTFSQNSSEQEGGGIYFFGTRSFSLINTTITKNQARTGTGVNITHAESATVANSIIGGNTENSSAQIVGDYLNISSIIQQDVSEIIDLTLQDNGGPTLTHALLVDSPAINAGDNSAVFDAGIFTDQRGFSYPRIVGGAVDVGAFEYLGTHLVVDSALDIDDGDYSVGNLSLREAVKLSNESATTDTITFAASLFDQTLTLLNELLITDDVSIVGYGADRLTITGDGTRRLIRIDDGDEETVIDVELSGFTLSNGFANYASGGAIHSVETLSVFDMAFANNRASVLTGPLYGGSYGGAIYSAGDLTVTHSTFAGNSADWYGGAIYSTAGLLTISDSEFTENETTQAGGAIVVQDGDLTIASSTFTQNSTESLGGAIYITEGVLTVSASTFTENSASLGGAIYHQISSSFPPVFTELSITDSTFQRNTASSSAGAVYYTSSVGFYDAYHTAYIENSLFSENSAGLGGALYIGGNNMLVFGSTFFKNEARNQGGAIYALSSIQTVQSSLFERNSASRLGGAIFVLQGQLQELIVINSTLSGNTAGSVGGGIAFGSILANFHIINSTITRNAATQGGGGIYSPGTPYGTLTNTIVAGNSAPGNAQGAFLYTRNNSIVQDSIEGLLDPVLRDNGGLTKTHALLPGSAAIDAGDDEALDAVNPFILNKRATTDDVRGDGFDRYRGEAIDIGAFEVQSPLALIEMTLVETPTSTAGNGEVATLPESLEWVDEWSGYWLEIWVSTPSAADLGVLSVALDLSYNTAITTATAIEYGAVFTSQQMGTIDDASGLITGLSATANATDAGDDQRVLFARIRFESLADDGIDLDLAGQTRIAESPEFDILGPEVLLTGDVETEEVQGPSPATLVYANPYDLNDDDAVNFRDLVLFASVYNTDARAAVSEYSWFADLDQSSHVNFRDLVSFAANYGSSKTNQGHRLYPENFTENKNGHLAVDPTLLPQENPESLEQPEAESVLEGVKTYLAPELTSEQNAQLAQVEIQVTELPPGVLSNSIGNTIFVDVNAAGYSWFVDQSPTDSDEFYESGYRLRAVPLGPTQGQIDLWTAILHEIGHILGHDHDENGLMSNSLEPGVRYLPDWFDQELDAFFSGVSEDSEPTLF